jgi:AraC-like DNA-binding protein
MRPEASRRRIVLRGADIAPLLAGAKARGVQLGALYKSLDLTSAQFEGDGVVALGDYFRLQHQISALLEDETLQLSRRQLLPGSTDFVLSQLAHATSLADAMRILARAYNLLHGGEFNSVRRKGHIVSFIIDDRQFPYADEHEGEFIHVSLECVQIFVHCILEMLSPGRADKALRRVMIRRAEREDDAPHLDFWPAPVRRSASVYALDYDLDAAAAAIEQPTIADLTAASVYRAITAASDASDREQRAGSGMAAFVRQALARGAIDQTSVAALAGISAPTLRRRLEEEGASFRDLRKEVLNKAAKRLLSDRKTVSQVADELGFSDYRSFTRAFKAWNGAPPDDFRTTIRKLSEKDT